MTSEQWYALAARTQTLPLRVLHVRDKARALTPGCDVMLDELETHLKQALDLLGCLEHAIALLDGLACAGPRLGPE